MKKHLTKWTLLVSMMCSMVAFTGCYKEDINDLKKTIAEQEVINAENATDINNLKILLAALEGRDYITSVTELPDNAGYKITFNSGSIINVYHGADGADGQDGAPGADGADGAPGAIASVDFASYPGFAVFTLAGSTTTISVPVGGSNANFPIPVSNLAELLAINGGEVARAQHYKLVADITITSAWTPIGNVSNHFNGSLDGGGHTITLNASVIAGTRAGLFNYIGVGGSVSRLTVVGDIDGSTDGALFVGGIAGTNFGSITNCAVLSNVTAITTDPGQSCMVGGIVGHNYGRIENCYATGTMTASGGYGQYIGGIAGDNEGSIINCVALNSSLISASLGSGSTNIGRVTGSNYTSLIKNYGFGTMGSTPSGTWTSSNTSIDGTDCNAIPTPSWWTNSQRWDTVNGTGTGWDFQNVWEVLTGQLPVLRTN